MGEGQPWGGGGWAEENQEIGFADRTEQGQAMARIFFLHTRNNELRHRQTGNNHIGGQACGELSPLPNEQIRTQFKKPSGRVLPIIVVKMNREVEGMAICQAAESTKLTHGYWLLTLNKYQP